ICGGVILFAFTKKLSAYASSSERSISPSRSGNFNDCLFGIFPPNFPRPSSIAASTTVSIATNVFLSLFVIITLTLYFSFPPFIDFGSHMFAYDKRTTPVITFVGFFTVFDIIISPPYIHFLLLIYLFLDAFPLLEQ